MASRSTVSDSQISSLLKTIIVFLLCTTIVGCGNTSARDNQFSYSAEVKQMKPCYGPDAFDSNEEQKCSESKKKIISNYPKCKKDIIESLHSTDSDEVMIAIELCSEIGDKDFISDLEQVATEKSSDKGLSQVSAVDALYKIEKNDFSAMKRISYSGVFPASSTAIYIFLNNEVAIGLDICKNMIYDKNIRSVDAKVSQKVSGYLDKIKTEESINIKKAWDKKFLKV